MCIRDSVKAFDALAGHVEAIERKAEALCRRQEVVSLKKWLDNQDAVSYTHLTAVLYNDGKIRFDEIADLDVGDLVKTYLPVIV